MTDDPRLAALARELARFKAGIVGSFAIPFGAAPRWDERSAADQESWVEGAMEDAAAILAALDAAGWTLVRTDYLIAEAFTSKPSDEATIARLRKIEEVAQAVLMAFDEMPGAVAGAMPVGVWVMFYNSIRGLSAALAGGSE